jgi:hypothetical protein
VKVIGFHCFGDCRSLERVTIPENSELLRVEDWAFLRCSVLRALVFPSSVIAIGSHCFEGCSSLSELTFASPSRLRELGSLPPDPAGPIAVPDSVEVIAYPWIAEGGVRGTLTFGPESRLIWFRASFVWDNHPIRSFVHLSSGSLKRFRSDFEFIPTETKYRRGR